MAKKKSRAQRASSAPKPPTTNRESAAKLAERAARERAAAAPKSSGRSPEAKGTRPKGPLKISGSADPQRLRASRVFRAAEPPSRLEINAGDRAERLGVAERRRFGERNTPAGLEWQRKAGGTDANETASRLQNERFDRARAKVKSADARMMSATKKIQAKKNAASKPAAAAPKPAAPAPKAEGKTAPQLAKELRVRKAPGLVDQTNAMFRRAEQAARRAEQKARVMSRMGDVAGKIGKIGKAAGTIGRGALAGAVKGASRGGDLRTRAILGTTLGVLGAAQAASSLYDGLRPYNNTATPKASPTPSPKPSSKPSPTPKSSPSSKASPKPSPARTPSPRPTPFIQSPEFQKQNEFLTKLSDKSYKRTADEQKAYDSIMKARANPGSGLVGAKIVGRKPMGSKKPGSKKM